MTNLVIGCLVILGITTIYQFVQLSIYAWKIRSPIPSSFEGIKFPQFAVLMPMRGSDPFLDEAILSVLDQDYPDFQVHIIIDHPDDPALKVVQETIEKRNTDHVRISFLEDKLDSCTLLNSAVCQFIANLDDSTELVLVSASDMIIPKNWLREAAIAMQDPTVGATVGNRWYMPRVGKFGSLVRYIWNTAANTSMWRFQGIWSGAMALRVTDIHRLGLPKIWSRSFCEDASTPEPLLAAGLKLKFVPQLVAINREEISVRGNFHFTRRQLFLTYMHHPKGLWMIFDSVPLSIISLVTLGLLAVSIFLNNAQAAAYAGTALVISSSLLGLVILITEFFVRRMMKLRGEKTEPISLSSVLLFAPAYLVCQIQYLYVIPYALFQRQVVWRGITYDVNIQKKEIRMLEYLPYSPPEVAEKQPVSI